MKADLEKTRGTLGEVRSDAERERSRADGERGRGHFRLALPVGLAGPEDVGTSG